MLCCDIKYWINKETNVSTSNQERGRNMAQDLGDTLEEAESMLKDAATATSERADVAGKALQHGDDQPLGLTGRSGPRTKEVLQLHGGRAPALLEPYAQTTRAVNVVRIFPVS
jgi:hypothetical protein